jgi:hypothetical protein
MTFRTATVLSTAAAVMSLSRLALAADPATPPPVSAPSPLLVAPDEAPTRSSVDYAAPPPAPAAPAPSTEWYGWQTLLVDGVALGTIPLELSPSASFARTPSASYLFVGSLSSYALGAPLVHVAHGRWGRGVADLGLRVGALAAGSLVGASLGKPGAPSSCEANLAGCFAQGSSGLAVGAAIGAVLASVIDASLLARDTTRPRETAAAASTTWSPVASITRGGGAAGLQASF